MRCILAHDHPFVVHNGQFASRASFPESVLQRYANAFGQVNVIGRQKIVDSMTLPPITDPRIRFHPVANVRSLRGLRHVPSVRTKIQKLVSDADCVIARLPSAIGLMSAVEAMRQNKPTMIEVVCNAFESNLRHGSATGPFAAPVEHALCKMVIQRSLAVVYITERYLQRIYPTNGRTFVCPNVEIIETVPHPTTPPSDGRWTMGLIGSLNVNYKGHALAIAALAQMKKKLPGVDLRLQFVGGGNPEPWRNMAAKFHVVDSIDFMGTLAPGKEVCRWHDTVDIVLQPSRVEAQGRSIIEAMSRGKPVLATNIGGIPELLPAECLVHPNDTNSLANKATDLIKDPSRYASVAAQNLEVSKSFLKPVVEARRNEAFDFLRSHISQAR